MGFHPPLPEGGIGPRDAAAFTGRPWRGNDPQASARVAAVPTMLSRAEGRFYHWLTRDWMRGRGAVVDLGCFVGGSTARLAEGHRQAGRPGTLHAFDRFTADETVKARFLYPRGIARFDGPDIWPLARGLLAPWADRVRMHRGDIAQATWKGGPIEVLTVDAFKCATTVDAMVAAFFPALVAGQSVVVHQDYLHWSQPWIAVLMQRFGDAFEPLCHVPGDTVAFLLRAPLTPGRIAAARIGSLSDADLLRGLAAARAGLPKWGLGPRFDTLGAGLRHNPGVRTAWRMRRPPSPVGGATDRSPERVDPADDMRSGKFRSVMRKPCPCDGPPRLPNRRPFPRA